MIIYGNTYYLFGEYYCAKGGPTVTLWKRGDVVYISGMTDATQIGWRTAPPQSQAKAVHLPPPDPVVAPVFIYDCVTPWGGETLLSLLMKRMMQRADGPSGGDQTPR